MSDVTTSPEFEVAEDILNRWMAANPRHRIYGSGLLLRLIAEALKDVKTSVWQESINLAEEVEDSAADPFGDGRCQPAGVADVLRLRAGELP